MNKDTSNMTFNLIKLLFLGFILSITLISFFGGSENLSISPNGIQWEETENKYKTKIEHAIGDYLEEISSHTQSLVDLLPEDLKPSINKALKDFTNEHHNLVKQSLSLLYNDSRPSQFIFSGTSIGIPKGYQTYLSPPSLERIYKLYLNELQVLSRTSQKNDNFSFLTAEIPPILDFLKHLKAFIEMGNNRDTNLTSSDLIEASRNYYIKQITTDLKLYDQLKEKYTQPRRSKFELACKKGGPCSTLGPEIIATKYLGDNSCRHGHDFFRNLSNDGLIITNENCYGSYEVVSSDKVLRKTHSKSNIKTHLRKLPRQTVTKIKQYFRGGHYKSDLKQLDSKFESFDAFLKQVINLKYPTQTQNYLEDFNEFLNQNMETSLFKSNGQLNTSISAMGFLLTKAAGIDQMRALTSWAVVSKKCSISYTSTIANYIQENSKQLERPLSRSEKDLVNTVKSIDQLSYCLYPKKVDACEMPEVFAIIDQFDQKLKEYFSNANTEVMWKNITFSDPESHFHFQSQSNCNAQSLNWITL